MDRKINPDLVGSHLLAAVGVEDSRLPVELAVHILPLLHLAIAGLPHGLALQHSVLIDPSFHRSTEIRN